MLRVALERKKARNAFASPSFKENEENEENEQGEENESDLITRRPTPSSPSYVQYVWKLIGYLSVVLVSYYSYKRLQLKR